METYRELYFHLFRTMARATALLEEGKVNAALGLLIAAQQEAEEEILRREEE